MVVIDGELKAPSAVMGSCGAIGACEAGGFRVPRVLWLAADGEKGAAKRLREGRGEGGKALLLIVMPWWGGRRIFGEILAEPQRGGQPILHAHSHYNTCESISTACTSSTIRITTC